MLEVVLSFLRVVAEYAGQIQGDGPGNKMDIDNLATVIAPCILYPKAKDATKVAMSATEDAFLAISAVKMMVTYLDEFVLVPPEFERINSNSSDVSGRDLGVTGDVRFSTGNSGAQVEGVEGNMETR